MSDASVAGEAVFGSMIAVAVLKKLQLKGLLDEEEVKEMVDQMMMLMEIQRLNPAGPGPAVIDHVLSRLGSLLGASSPKQR